VLKSESRKGYSFRGSSAETLGALPISFTFLALEEGFRKPDQGPRADRLNESKAWGTNISEKPEREIRKAFLCPRPPQRR